MWRPGYPPKPPTDKKEEWARAGALNGAPKAQIRYACPAVKLEDILREGGIDQYGRVVRPM